MILTVNSDCTSVLIQSDVFNTDNTSNVLSVSINGGAATEIELSSSIATSYTFNAASLDLDALEAGVYEFLITATLADTTVQTDLGCTALLCAYECDVDTLELYSDVANIDKILAYEGLKNFANCSTCSCTLANTLHNAFTNTTTTNATSCGCG